jgi:hypothetical protein
MLPKRSLCTQSSMSLHTCVYRQYSSEVSHFHEAAACYSLVSDGLGLLMLISKCAKFLYQHVAPHCLRQEVSAGEEVGLSH